MIKIMGNSSERVPIKDLNDVIYYKQIKEYTDQEYDNSKDLKVALSQGRLILLEKIVAGRQSSFNITDKNASITIKDLKAVLREMLPEFKDNGSGENLTQAIREIGPLIASIVRQELSHISLSRQGEQSKIEDSKFLGPEYVPDVSMEGMISNIEAKTKEVSGADLEDSMAALRKLNKK